MAASQVESGTKDFAADIGTTWDVLNVTTPLLTDAALEVVVDMTNLIAGDTVEVRVMEKPTGTGDTAVEFMRESRTGVQAQPIILRCGLMLFGYDVQMRQTAGTGRTFKWSIRNVT